MTINPHFETKDNGNMTRGPDFTNLGQITQRRVAYDTDNMPTQVWAAQSGVTTYFSYDGDGDRVKKTTTGGAVIYYVGDHYEIKNDESLKYIFAGNLRLIMIKDNNTFYYHKDHLNSTSVMTDNSGAVVETAQYEPFGATRDHTGTDMSAYKFTDQELDNETNLYNYDARLYDPVIGRFGTADNIVQNWYDPQSLNAYAYCRNNPLIYTDPTGHLTQIEGTPGQPDEFSVHEDKKGSSTIVEGGKRFIGVEARNLANYILTEDERYYNQLRGELGHHPTFKHFLQDIMAGLFGGRYSNLGEAFIAGKVMQSEVPGILPSAGSRTNVNWNLNAKIDAPKNTGLADDLVSNSTIVGKRGAPIEIQPGTNLPAKIDGRAFSGHALDRMQGRGIFSSVVENTIKNGEWSWGNSFGTLKYYDSVNKVTVIKNYFGKVITVY